MKWGSPKTTADIKHTTKIKTLKTNLVKHAVIPGLTHLTGGTCNACSHWRAGVWSSNGSCQTRGSSNRSWGHRISSETVQGFEEVSCKEVNPSHALGLEYYPQSSLLSGPERRCCRSSTAVLLRTWDCGQISQTVSVKSVKAKGKKTQFKQDSTVILVGSTSL